MKRLHVHVSVEDVAAASLAGEVLRVIRDE